MANIRQIRRRIKSAKNISQITKAMELVAASKMKKAQGAALSGKLYASRIYDAVMLLARKTDYENHPLLSRPKQPTGKRLVVLVTTNKGLCGGLNANMFRYLSKTFTLDGRMDFVTVGRKGAEFVTHFSSRIIADFSAVSPFSQAVPAITELLTREFPSGAYDGVDLIFNDFVSVITQTPKTKTVLPLTIESAGAEGTSLGNFRIEPDVATVFDRLLPHYIENQIRDAILEGEASEHSARMVAMRNATDNAMNLTSELTLVYNKVRQEKITYEINDIITAKMAAEA